MEVGMTLELPDWMKPFMESQIKGKVTDSFHSSKANPSLLKARTTKNCTLCKQFYEIAEYCEKLLSRAEKNTLVLGFDLDWPNTYKSVFKTKQIHICCGENECAIFNIAELESLPRALTLLLKNPNVSLVGFSIRKDLEKLGKDYVFDVDEVIGRLQKPEKYSEEKLTCCHQWSVKSVIEQTPELGDEPTYPQIEKFIFKGVINYSKTLNDCGAVCEKLLRVANYLSGDKNLVFGFDVEWPFTYKAGPGNGKVALIQMCPEERICFLFHVATFKSLPKSLVLLLKHDRVKLSGLNIANDIKKIGRDFRIDVEDILKSNLIELSTLANRKLRTRLRWSLDGLVLNQLHMVLEKPSDIRISNWAADPLKREQITYAASDAYASLAVYNHLMGIKPRQFLKLVK